MLTFVGMLVRDEPIIGQYVIINRSNRYLLTNIHKAGPRVNKTNVSYQRFRDLKVLT